MYEAHAFVHSYFRKTILIVERFHITKPFCNKFFIYLVIWEMRTSDGIKI